MEDHREPDGCLIAAAIIIVAIMLVIGIPVRNACVEKGGVFLWREFACVDAPDQENG